MESSTYPALAKVFLVLAYGTSGVVIPEHFTISTKDDGLGMDRRSGRVVRIIHGVVLPPKNYGIVILLSDLASVPKVPVHLGIIQIYLCGIFPEMINRVAGAVTVPRIFRHDPAVRTRMSAKPHYGFCALPAASSALVTLSSRSL